MKRLYDDEWCLNDEGRDADTVAARRLNRMIKDLVDKKGYDPHDVERVVTRIVCYQLTMWKLRHKAQLREEEFDNG